MAEEFTPLPEISAASPAFSNQRELRLRFVALSTYWKVKWVGLSPFVKDVSSCPILRPVPQAFVPSF